MAKFFEKKDIEYPIMVNFFNDSRLTLKSKGLLGQLLTLPNDFNSSITSLAEINPESRDAIRSSLNELEKYGYIERCQTKKNNGKFSNEQILINPLLSVLELAERFGE